jgi:hypothetical protein
MGRVRDRHRRTTTSVRYPSVPVNRRFTPTHLCLFSFAELLSDMYNHTHTVINAHERSYVHWFSCVFSFSFPIIRAPIDVSLERRAELIRSLDSWNFEPHKLPENEVLYCSLVIFEALFRLDGLLDMIPVSIGV